MTDYFKKFKTVTPKTLTISKEALANLESNISKFAFRELGELQLEAAGFIPNDKGEYVTKVDDSYLIQIRTDKKIIDARHVKREAQNRLLEKKANGEDVDPNNKKQLKEQQDIIAEKLLVNAQIKDTYSSIILIPEKELILFNQSGAKVEFLVDFLTEAVREKIIYDFKVSNDLANSILSLVKNNTQTNNLKFSGVYVFKDNEANAQYTIKNHDAVDNEVLSHTENEHNKLAQIGLLLLNETYEFKLNLELFSITGFKMLTIEPSDSNSVDYYILLKALIEVFEYFKSNYPLLTDE
jgi:hypothetical protein